jgi:cytoskeletal protein CcmA (bactofilin family)
MFGGKDKKREIEEMSSATSTVSAGTVIQGDIESMGNIRLEGNVNGNVTSKSKLAMGDSAKVFGNILAQNAEIAGEVNGKLEVADLLILKATSVINGDIFTNKLIVESGATFNGSCKMGAVIKDIKVSQTNGAKEKTA